MSKRNGAIVLATSAVLAAGLMVNTARAADRATDTGSFSKQPLYLDEPSVQPGPAAPATPAPTTPNSESLINDGLNKIGVGKVLTDWGLVIGGAVEGSYTYNTRAPGNNISEGRVFDFEHDAARLNQLSLQVGRVVDVAAAAKAGKVDIGFGVDMMYGSDARLIHSNGLAGYNNSTHPINQFDLTQAYLDIILPVGTGLDIKVGKFVTLFGIETIAPVASVLNSAGGNTLYSHSYQFGFGIPFTSTGITASYAFNDKIAVTGGITRGWEQSTNDNNSSIDLLGQVKYTPTKTWTFYFNASVGPQEARNNHDYRTLVEAIAQYAPENSAWSFGVDGIYGYEDHAALSGSTATWYGVTGYTGYKLCDMATLNGRVEYFRDQGGSRLGVTANVYEGTLGVALKPFYKDKIGSNLVIRPEIRGDLADKAVFDSGRHKSQATVAIDAVFSL